MNALRLLPVAVVAALAVAVSAGVGASSEPPLLAETSPGRFPDRSYVLTLPEKQPLSAAQVGVTENGEPVDKLSVLPASQAAGGAAVVLAIDTSNSMRGKPIQDAGNAARAFVAKTPATVKIGVVTFNQDVNVVLAPTTDRAAINEALTGTPELKEKTRLYDALDVARLQLSATHAQTSSIVLLTDGNDIGSSTTEESVVGRLTGDAYRVFTVGSSRSSSTRRCSRGSPSRQAACIRRLRHPGAHADLRRPRLPARQRVPRALSLTPEAGAAGGSRREGRGLPGCDLRVQDPGAGNDKRRVPEVSARSDPAVATQHDRARTRDPGTHLVRRRHAVEGTPRHAPHPDVRLRVDAGGGRRTHPARRDDDDPQGLRPLLPPAARCSRLRRRLRARRHRDVCLDAPPTEHRRRNPPRR